MFDFSIVTQWVHSLLTSFMPEELAVLIECIVIGVCIMLAYAVIAIIMIFMERKVCAAFQCRLGPMRVGSPRYHTGVCRCIQDVDQGNYHHPAC